MLTQRTDVGFSSGRYVAPNGHSSVAKLDPGQRFAETPITVTAGSITDVSVPITGILVLATVGPKGNAHTPTPGLAQVELLQNGTARPAVDDGHGSIHNQPGDYFAASSIGVRVRPAPGQQVVDVSASTTNGPLAVKREGNDFTIMTRSLPWSAGGVTFAIEVGQPVVTATPSVTPRSSATSAAGAATAGPTDAAAEGSPAAPAPEPWVWVASAGVVLLLAGGVAAVLVRRRAVRRARDRAAREALPDISRFAPASARSQAPATPSGTSPTPGDAPPTPEKTLAGWPSTPAGSPVRAAGSAAAVDGSPHGERSAPQPDASTPSATPGANGSPHVRGGAEPRQRPPKFGRRREFGTSGAPGAHPDATRRSPTPDA